MPPLDSRAVSTGERRREEKAGTGNAGSNRFIPGLEMNCENNGSIVVLSAGEGGYLLNR
jgi:hypothetical protein